MATVAAGQAQAQEPSGPSLPPAPPVPALPVPQVAKAAAKAGVAATAGAVGVTAATLHALSRVLAQQRMVNRRWLAEHAGPRPGAATLRQLETERQRETTFARVSAGRVTTAMPRALSLDSPQARQAAVKSLLERERGYARQQATESMRRLQGAVNFDRVQESSPLGAMWLLGPAKDHTEGCLHMQRRFWPWAVLMRVHPPRHHGCTGYLIGLDEAVGAGLMGPGDIPTLYDAINDASGVMMEGAAERLLGELEVREQLIARGVGVGQLARIPWLGEGYVAEAFDVAEHPRGWHGRFRDLGITPPKWLDEPVVKDLMAGRVAAEDLGPRHVAGGDPFFGRVAAAVGFDGKPRVVSPETMDQLVAGGAKEVLRGVQPGPEGPGQHAEGFRSGSLWPGHGVWGSGTYAYDAHTRFGEPWLRGQLAKATGGHPEGLLRIAIPQGTRTIEYGAAYDGLRADLATLDRMIESGEGDTAGLMRARAAFANIGRWAALNGHQAIHVPEEDLHVILDRGAVAVQDGGGGVFVKPEEAAAALKRGEPSAVRAEDVPALVEHLRDTGRSSLHLLQVEGYPNLFRENARDLPRAAMPQIPSAHLPGFMDFLREHRVMATVERVAPGSLRATQNQINGAAVAAIVKGWEPDKGGILMISREGDVLDGHHRWAGAALHEVMNPGHKIDVLRFTASTDRMLQLMREYNAQAGVEARAFGEGKHLGATG